MKKLKAFLPHLCLVLSGAFAVLIVLNILYPNAAFFSAGPVKGLLFLSCMASILLSLMQITKYRREESHVEEREPVFQASSQEGYIRPDLTESAKAPAMLSKVPEITIFFWIIKVLCTTVGETASDFLNVNLNFGLTGTAVVSGILLAILLFFQFRARKYIPVIYWLTVVLISIFGTLVTDYMSEVMNVPLEYSTIGFSIALILTFAVWLWSEKTLSIHSIYTKKRESFYWLTILFTFALGTASGDLISEGLGMGYLKTGLIVCAVVIAVVIALKLKMNGDLAFWLVYIMTRPLGASLGDLLTQPPKFGGLGLGATITSLIFVSAILLTVAFLSITKMDQISKPSSKPVQESGQSQRSFLVQSAAAICVIALVGGGGYAWRENALKTETNIYTTQASPTDSSAPSPQPTQPADVPTAIPKSSPRKTNAAQSTTSLKTPATASAAAKATPSPTPQNMTNPKLGDMSSFITIEQDMLDMVNKGDLAGAKNRADDLEYNWDTSEAHLKPKNPTEWTKIDRTLDALFRQVRSVKPTVDGCKSALNASLSAFSGT